MTACAIHEEIARVPIDAGNQVVEHTMTMYLPVPGFYVRGLLALSSGRARKRQFATDNSPSTALASGWQLLDDHAADPATAAEDRAAAGA